MTFKINNFIIVVTFLSTFILFGCNRSKSKSKHGLTTDSVKIDSVIQLNSPNEINFDDTKIIRSEFVISRSGAEYKDLPKSNSKTLGRLEYGDPVEVIKDTLDWVEARIMVQDIGWAGVYMEKTKTGPATMITITPNDLMKISHLSLNNDTNDVSNKININRYLEIKLISKDEYLIKRQKTCKYFLTDTGLFKKKNGVIELKIQKGIKRFIDTPKDAEENTKTYNYIGQYQLLNQYLISASYYEDYDFELVDKTSGNISSVFGEFPFVSLDKKYIVSIFPNVYDVMTADLCLYNIKDNHLQPILCVSFSKWMPSGNTLLGKEGIFWADDNCLYVEAVPSNAFWKENGSYNDSYQYLKITIK